MTSQSKSASIIIIGAGFSGIGMAAQLQKAGFTDVAILEQAGSIGGTWRDNSYPGAACDVMSHLYSFSFYQNPKWSNSYSGWNEIRLYLEDCVDHFNLRSKIQFNAEVESCEYLADNAQGFQWRVNVKGDATPLFCHFLVAASGVFSRVSIPNFPKSDGGAFHGESFHTGRWDHSVSLEGKHVAVVGTGASAIQVIPEVVKAAAHVTVFQRTPAWVMERYDIQYPEWQKKLFQFIPLALWFSRFLIYARHEILTCLFVSFPSIFRFAEYLSKRLLKKQVKDPVRRELLTPKYSIGCKRILVSNTYYPAMASDKVTIVSESIEGVGPRGIVTKGGQEHPCDVIVYATGFQITDVSGMHSIVGRKGDDVRALWTKEGQYGFLGTFVNGFPNVAFMLGPNSGLGTNSVVFMIECQVNMVVRLLKEMQQHQLKRIEVKSDVEIVFNRRVQHALKGTIWLSGCRSWYLNAKGRNTTMWPFTTLRFWWETATIGLGAFNTSC